MGRKTKTKTKSKPRKLAASTEPVQPRRKPTSSLPPDLLESFKRDPLIDDHSIIYDEAFDEYRCRLLSADIQLRSAMVCERPGSDYWSKMGSVEGSYLHLAIVAGDIPLAHECIRLGVPTDSGPSRASEPPLNLACKLIADLHHTRVPVTAVGRRHKEQKRARLVRIVRFLLEQHAGTGFANSRGQNATWHACAANDLEVIKMLLEHGSRPVEIVFDELGPRDDDADKVLALFENIKPFSPRPPRPCPCFSGKLLSECHVQKQAYPDWLVCFCGSDRLFERCCKKRNFHTWEVWDEELKFIHPFNEYDMESDLLKMAPESMRPGLNNFMQRTLNGRMPEVPSHIADWAEDLQRIHADFLLKRKEVDPAFAFALAEVNFRATVWDKTQSKVECQEKMTLWNTAVDKYIASGMDPRPRRDIEIQAKIGMDGGALYRRCDRPGCKVVEQGNAEKLKSCSECKAAYYCSSACQKAHWNEHKSKCQILDHTAQLLPSQGPYTELVNALYCLGGGTEFLMKFMEATPEMEPELLRAEAERIPKYFEVRLAEIRAMEEMINGLMPGAVAEMMSKHGSSLQDMEAAFANHRISM